MHAGLKYYERTACMASNFIYTAKTFKFFFNNEWHTLAGINLHYVFVIHERGLDVFLRVLLRDLDTNRLRLIITQCIALILKPHAASDITW